MSDVIRMVRPGMKGPVADHKRRGAINTGILIEAAVAEGWPAEATERLYGSPVTLGVSLEGDGRLCLTATDEAKGLMAGSAIPSDADLESAQAVATLTDRLVKEAIEILSNAEETPA